MMKKYIYYPQEVREISKWVQQAKKLLPVANELWQRTKDQRYYTLLVETSALISYGQKSWRECEVEKMTKKKYSGSFFEERMKLLSRSIKCSVNRIRAELGIEEKE